MLIKSKVTTLQVVSDSTVEKPYVYLNNSIHAVKDIIPVVVDISASEPIQLHNVHIVFELIHPLTKITLEKFETIQSHFLFSVIQPHLIQATLYIPSNYIPIYYGYRGLDFSSRVHEILYELQISIISTEQNTSKITINTGAFYVN